MFDQVATYNVHLVMLRTYFIVSFKKNKSNQCNKNDTLDFSPLNTDINIPVVLSRRDSYVLCKDFLSNH